MSIYVSGMNVTKKTSMIGWSETGERISLEETAIILDNICGLEFTA